MSFGALHSLDVGRAKRSCFQYGMVILGGLEMWINSGQSLTTSPESQFQVLRLLLSFRIGRLFWVPVSV